MPGAYEKQMHGEHYELILNSVQECRQHLNNEDFEALQFSIPILLVHQQDRSKSSIEKFCYGGGFRLMCEILQLRGITESVGDVSPILDNFSSLLAIEFDPCEP